MPKFRKKPVVVEVSRWFKHGDHPAVVEDRSPYVRHDHGWIETLEGGHPVAPGDWIVTGTHGECYPVKDGIFRTIYEPADEDESEAAARALAAYNRFLATLPEEKRRETTENFLAGANEDILSLIEKEAKLVGVGVDEAITRVHSGDVGEGYVWSDIASLVEMLPE